MTSAENLVQALASHHASVDAERLLRPFTDVLVRTPGGKRFLFEPYIPFVGPGYEPGGVLTLSAAQNLAQLEGSEDSMNWRLSTGMPDAPLYRMYRVGDRTVARTLDADEVSFSAIAMQPFEDGVLPALAGLAMLAAGENPPGDLNGVTQRIAATNFYKHSLRASNGNDLNPTEASFRDRLPAYSELTLRTFAGPEIEILQPAMILAFMTVPRTIMEYAPKGSRRLDIRDPSWVKRGMGGVARPPNGSWYQEAQTVQDSGVRQLVENYLDEMPSIYRIGKRDAMRTYLLVHYLRFRSAMA